MLRIGDGPQFVAINGGPNATPRIDHYCLTVENFNVDRLMKVLAEHGVTPVDAGATGGGLSGGPMKSRVRMRGPEAGGAKEGSPEIYFGDPDGIVVQLQDPKYCGGAGPARRSMPRDARARANQGASRRARPEPLHDSSIRRAADECASIRSCSA